MKEQKSKTRSARTQKCSEPIPVLMSNYSPDKKELLIEDYIYFKNAVTEEERNIAKGLYKKLLKLATKIEIEERELMYNY